MARLRALIRRAESDAADDPVVVIGGYNVDPRREKSSRAAPRRRPARPEQVHLTKTEWGGPRGPGAQTPAAWSPASSCSSRFWGPAYRSETNYLRFYPREAAPEARAGAPRIRGICSPEPGMGYRFQP